jgi:pimeloyl-ACP methyl ester carboxylesterase
MKNVVLVTLLTLFSISTFAQSYQVGHTSVTFIDSSRGNRSVPTEIYYPSDIAGDNVAFATMPGKAPVIAFGHGFVMTYDAYFNFRDAIVPKGYILAFPTTEGSLSPSHGEFGKDLAFVLRAVAKLGNSTSSPMHNKVDTFNCVMGHSMGGGASMLALAYDPTIKAVANFAAAETSPSAIAAAGSANVPALLFAGQNDCVTAAATNQQPMYAALPSACKHYISIKGGSHCQMALSNVACNFGESTCTPAPAISRAAQHDVINTFLLPWLDYRLKASCAAGNLFDTKLVSETTITFEKNCDLCSTANVQNVASHTGVTVYPNPATDHISFTNLPSGYTKVSITSLSGRNIDTAELNNGRPVMLQSYPEGIYIYQVSGNNVAPLRGIFRVSK